MPRTTHDCGSYLMVFGHEVPDGLQVGSTLTQVFEVTYRGQSRMLVTPTAKADPVHAIASANQDPVPVVVGPAKRSRLGRLKAAEERHTIEAGAVTRSEFAAGLDVEIDSWFKVGRGDPVQVPVRVLAPGDALWLQVRCGASA